MFSARKTETERHTETERGRQTETDRHKQRQTEIATDRDRDRDTQKECSYTSNCLNVFGLGLSSKCLFKLLSSFEVKLLTAKQPNVFC